MPNDPLQHIPTPGKPIPGMQVFLRIIAIVCPVVWIFIATCKAVYSGYSATYLTDPGHKRIRIYDVLIVLTSIVLTYAAFAYTFNFDVALFFTAVNQGFWKALFAIQFTGWESFVIIYVLSFLLYFYDTRREKIIGDINRHHRVW